MADPVDLPSILADAGITKIKSMRPGHQEQIVCPRCSGGKRREVSLSVKIDADGEGATWHCWRGSCGYVGGGRTRGQDGRSRPAPPPEPKPIVKPVEPSQKPRPPALYRFFEQRGISQTTVDHFGCYVTRHWFPGDKDHESGEYPAIVFPYRFHGELVNRKYRPPHKNPMVQDKNALPTLFNVDGLADAPDDAWVVWVEGECFPPSAEVLTQDGWKPIPNLKPDDLVAQSDPETQDISFVSPTAYIKRPFSGDLVRWESKGYCSVTTPGHRLLRRGSNGTRGFVQASELRPTSGGIIPRVGQCAGPGILLSDDEIRLAVAIAADGSIDNRLNTWRHKCPEARYVRFALLKQRKIDRLRQILDRLGILASDNEDGRGFRSICFPIGDWVPGKTFPWRWLVDMTARQREIVIGELVHWDGNSVPNRHQEEFSSKDYDVASWVQALCHTTGRVSTIIPRSNQYGAWFKVSILHRKRHSSAQCLRRSNEPYDGDVYCVAVPSGAILVRQEDRVTITGNCDVMALHEAGWPYAVTLKDGAPDKLREEDDPARQEDKRFAAIETHADLLTRFQRIILAGDADKPGEVLREELARRLGRHRVWTVRWPEGCKDAGDVLRLHGPDVLSNCIIEAQPWPIEGVQRITPGLLQRLRERKPPPVMSTGTKSTNAIMKLPAEGRLIVVTGVPNSGKSSWVRFVMVHTAREHARRWVCFSPEHSPWEQFVAECAEVFTGRTFWCRRDAEQMSADELAHAERWLGERIFMLTADNEDTPPTLDWFLDRVRRLVLVHGITDALLDPWNELEHTRPDRMTETEWVGLCLQRIKAFCNKHGVNIWIVAHPTKQIPPKPGGKLLPPGGYDIAGGANWANKTDFGLTVHNDDGLSLILIWKSRFSSRWGRKNSVARLEFDMATHRYYDPPSIAVEPPNDLFDNGED